MTPFARQFLLVTFLSLLLVVGWLMCVVTCGSGVLFSAVRLFIWILCFPGSVGGNVRSYCSPYSTGIVIRRDGTEILR
jgi:hypothetical protein